MTTRGFYSIVQKDIDKNASTLTVRARTKQDLMNLNDLIEVTPYCLPSEMISDYPWRATVDKDQWSVAMLQLVQEINYDNFKDAVEEVNPLRVLPYMHVWWTLMDIEDEENENLIRDGYIGTSA